MKYYFSYFTLRLRFASASGVENLHQSDNNLSIQQKTKTR